MNIISAMGQRFERLASAAELNVEPAELPAAAMALSDESVMHLLRDLADLSNDVGRLQSVLAGVTAQRSRREQGHAGLAATEGHATATGLIQAITGGSRADADRHLRVGSSLLEDVLPPDASRPPTGQSDGGGDRHTADGSGTEPPGSE